MLGMLSSGVKPVVRGVIKIKGGKTETVLGSLRYCYNYDSKSAPTNGSACKSGNATSVFDSISQALLSVGIRLTCRLHDTLTSRNYVYGFLVQ